MLPKFLRLISTLLLFNLGRCYGMESEPVFVPAPLDSKNGLCLISATCFQNYYDGETITLALHKGYRHMIQVSKTGRNNGFMKKFEIGTAPGGGERHLPLPGPYYSFPIRDPSREIGVTQVDEVVFTKDGKLVKVVYYYGFPKIQIESEKYQNCAQQLRLSISASYYTSPVHDTEPDQKFRRKWDSSRKLKGASSGGDS